jgi:hypothetical protein
MTDEHPDSETALLKALADVNKFKKEFRKEVRSLRTQFDELNGRVESLELMDFQEQLNRLNELTSKTSGEITEIKRMVFQRRLGDLHSFIRFAMHLTGHASTSPPTWGQAQHDCDNEICVYYARTTERINQYKDIKDMEKAFHDFWDNANDILGKYGFPEITELGKGKKILILSSSLAFFCFPQPSSSAKPLSLLLLSPLLFPRLTLLWCSPALC